MAGPVALLTLVALLTILVVLAAVLSTRMTRRQEPDPLRSPAEYGLEFEETRFQARDGLSLGGWWIPSPGSRRAILFLHGHGGSMDPDVQYVPAFHQAGFNVLMFDFRAHGRSEGDMGSIGFLEREDVLGAVDLLLEKGMHRIGVLGFSMGAVVAMLSAPICPSIGAVVSDGGFAYIGSAIMGWAKEKGVPSFIARPLMLLTLLATSVRLRVNLFRFQPVEWVGKIAPRPILFIHGLQDPFVPPKDFQSLVVRAGDSSEIWALAEAGHRQIDELYPQEYRDRLVGFFNRHLSE